MWPTGGAATGASWSAGGRNAAGARPADCSATIWQPDHLIMKEHGNCLHVDQQMTYAAPRSHR